VLIAAGLTLAVAVAAGVPLALRAAETNKSVPANGIGVRRHGNLGHLRTGNAGVAAQPGRGEGWVWATSPDGNAVYRIDPATQAIGVGAEPDGIAWADGDVWVANSSDGTVSQINSVTG
jgi:DNA-binding beta-propeller fold protein YncE